MSTVAQILKSKPVNQPVRTLPPDATVREAIELMAEQRIGALLVAEGERIVGIFTERDYARKIEVRGRASATTRLAEVMTPDVLHVSPATTTQECMALMTDKRLRHLPVLDAGQVVGMVSIGDLVKEIISEQQFMIAQLESYIHS
ncbi:signal-transduction protein [Sphaerotilus natans subsp. natans DSM 6575]|uniref:Signal-transduction protein n=1 Tax=Sphaerotilus natans subsp. natans DSM 6575 TaxID=1286631 RepID=A0A059KRC9_9BURK|nr:CBS domain-containing protein [Sphaerotilus natans]KDB53663.1 signal-transduction protein [Sphaerotilus natans subsp. natans DSM 6575]SIR34094.1 CBS domain-containing protein [Sphaerotilus natans]